MPAPRSPFGQSPDRLGNTTTRRATPLVGRPPRRPARPQPPAAAQCQGSRGRLRRPELCRQAPGTGPSNLATGNSARRPGRTSELATINNGMQSFPIDGITGRASVPRGNETRDTTMRLKPIRTTLRGWPHGGGRLVFFLCHDPRRGDAAAAARSTWRLLH
jgi:hypothetical protein